jgi:hypothetical protein
MGRASPSLTLSDIRSRAERDVLRFRVQKIDEADARVWPEAAENDVRSNVGYWWLTGYLTTLGLRGCDGSGAAGETAKVAQTVKPSGRFSGAKSR